MTKLPQPYCWKRTFYFGPLLFSTLCQERKFLSFLNHQFLLSSTKKTQKINISLCLSIHSKILKYLTTQNSSFSFILKSEIQVHFIAFSWKASSLSSKKFLVHIYINYITPLCASFMCTDRI